MSYENDGGPAFPVSVAMTQVPGQDVVTTESSDFDGAGMTLRDWFAGKALCGAIANPEEYEGNGDMYEVIATNCYRFADAMLAAREAK